MRLSIDEVRKQRDGIKKLYEQGLRGATASVEQVLNLFDTIEALQQENNGWQERYYELDAGHSRLFKDFCKLQQENEQLRTQITQIKKAIQKLKETINAWDKATWFECTRCGSIHDTLTTITKMIGGAEDGSSKDE